MKWSASSRYFSSAVQEVAVVHLLILPIWIKPFKQDPCQRILWRLVLFKVGADYMAPMMQDLRVERHIMSGDMTTLCPAVWSWLILWYDSKPATLKAGFVGSNPLKGHGIDCGLILSVRLFWYARWSRNTVFDIFTSEDHLDLRFHLNLVLLALHLIMLNL